MKLKKLTLCALFTALMAVSAFIKIPIPTVPITFQVQIVLITAVLLGRKYGLISTALYIFLGLVGLPIFSGGGGFHYVLVPSFGYIIGFLPAVFLCGLCHRHGSFRIKYTKVLLYMLLGLLTVYLVGTVYCGLVMKFYLNNYQGLWSLLLSCVFIPIVKDLALLPLMAFLATRLYAPLQKAFL
ncbi:MAG: biotin transporter BioY [Ruminococcus sp.]